jgi:hypothetical protein
MLVQTLDEEDSNKYFIPPKNLECNEGGRLGINKEIKIHIWKFYALGNRILRCKWFIMSQYVYFVKGKGVILLNGELFFCGYMVHSRWLISNTHGMNILCMCFFLSNFQCFNLCVGPLTSSFSMHISISMP